MWLIIRIVMIFVGLWWRFKDWVFLPEPLTHGNEPYYLKKNKNRTGYDSIKIGVKFASDVHFSFTRENKFNIFFKTKGFHSEFQTGDADFDRMVYIASDHPMLHYLLKNSQSLRREITRLFALGYATIWNENKLLWICAESPRTDVPDIVLDSLMELREALLKLNSQRAKLIFDKFYHRALMIETVVWTIAGYALAAILENYFVDQDYHLDQSSLIYSELILALLMMAGLLVLAYLLLRRSSRAHRVIVETLIVGVISMPVAGIQLVSDLNRKLDSKPSIMIVDTVQDLTKKRSSYTSRRGRRKIYYLVPARNYNDQEVSLPSKIKINRQIFDQLHKGQRIRFEIGRGYLGHPWYRDIQFWK